MELSRRLVLKYGLAGASVLLLAGTGLALQGTTPREPRQPLQALSSQEFSILWALADRMAPAHENFPAASTIEVPERIDSFLASVDPATRGEVKLLLKIVENALPGLILDGRVRPFSKCSPETQDAILEGWRTSSISARRTIFKALNNLVAATYYGSPETYAAVGYPGPPNYGNLK